jgi:transposase
MTTPACRGADTEIFYDTKRWAKAAQYCRGCPVVLQCRKDFADDPYAYAGGMTPTRRNAWVRRSKDSPRPVAGPTREPLAPPTPTSGTRSRLTDEQRAEIIRIFDTERLGTKAIGDRLGVAKSTVQRALRQAGRERSQEEIRELCVRGGEMGGQKALGERNAGMVVQLFADGYKAKEVAEMVGITLSHVYVTRRKEVAKMVDERKYHVEVIAKMTGLTEEKVFAAWKEYGNG